MNSTSDYPRINFSAGAMNFMHNSTGTGTIEFWANSSTCDQLEQFGLLHLVEVTKLDLEFIPSPVALKSDSLYQKEYRDKVHHAATGKTPNGKWVHIAAVKTPTELRLYTDGVLRSKVDISSYSFSGSNSARNYIQHGSPPQQSGGILQRLDWCIYARF